MTCDYFPPQDSGWTRIWKAVRRMFAKKPACPCTYSKVPGPKVDGHEVWCRNRSRES